MLADCMAEVVAATLFFVIDRDGMTIIDDWSGVVVSG